MMYESIEETIYRTCREKGIPLLCRYMNNEMLRVIANQIEDSASSIQYNCLEYLDLLEEGGKK